MNRSYPHCENLMQELHSPVDCHHYHCRRCGTQLTEASVDGGVDIIHVPSLCLSAGNWTLPNGYVLIEKRLASDGQWIALCCNLSAAQRYVTWLVNNDGEAYWGHYTNDVQEAVTDYMERS